MAGKQACLHTAMHARAMHRAQVGATCSPSPCCHASALHPTRGSRCPTCSLLRRRVAATQGRPVVIHEHPPHELCHASGPWRRPLNSHRPIVAIWLPQFIAPPPLPPPPSLPCPASYVRAYTCRFSLPALAQGVGSALQGASAGLHVAIQERLQQVKRMQQQDAKE